MKRFMLVSLLLLSKPLLANQCVGENQTVTVALGGSLSVPVIAPVGQVIKSIPLPSSPLLDCEDNQPISALLLANRQGSQQHDHIIQTAIAGLGIRLTLQQATPLYAGSQPQPFSQTPQSQRIDLPAMTLEIIKTAPAVSAVDIPTAGLLQQTLSYPTSNGVIQVQLQSAPVSVTNGGCLVEKQHDTVDLGNISVRQLGGIGRTAGEKRFTMGLYCAPNQHVRLISQGSVSDKRLSSAAELGILQNELTDNLAARGIGIQVLQQGSPLDFTALSGQSLGVALSGYVQVPFSARFYQTAAQVSAGQVQSTLVFTLDYD